MTLSHIHIQSSVFSLRRHTGKKHSSLGRGPGSGRSRFVRRQGRPLLTSAVAATDRLAVGHRGEGATQVPPGICFIYLFAFNLPSCCKERVMSAADPTATPPRPCNPVRFIKSSSYVARLLDLPGRRTKLTRPSETVHYRRTWSVTTRSSLKSEVSKTKTSIKVFSTLCDVTKR